MNKKIMFTSCAALCLLSWSITPAPAQTAKIGPDMKTWDDVARNAAKFLQGTQDKNGGWSTDKTPGVTGIALTGLLKARQATPQDPVGQKALKYIESLVNPEKKHIAGKDPKNQLLNYVTFGHCFDLTGNCFTKGVASTPCIDKHKV